MDNRILIGAVIIVLVLIVGVVAITTMNQNINNKPHVAAIYEKSTKFDIANNNSVSWLHMDMAIENVTAKNGSVNTYYIDAFVQPNSNLTIDLSNLFGYGNEKLPAGTYRVLSWLAAYNPTAGNNTTLNFTLQGWSNTFKPGPADQKYPFTFPNAPIYALKNIIKDNSAFTSTNPADLEDVYDDDANENIYMEFLLIVAPDGKVTLNVTRIPEFCSLAAGHNF
ncbi:MAG TPA: hypothetical protein VK444_05370 [Methanobacteriaceae archaeon]|nr:hypothetical protein [Methanobacteriaceae archaeon]